MSFDYGDDTSGGGGSLTIGDLAMHNALLILFLLAAPHAACAVEPGRYMLTVVINDSGVDRPQTWLTTLVLQTDGIEWHALKRNDEQKWVKNGDIKVTVAQKKSGTDVLSFFRVDDDDRFELQFGGAWPAHEIQDGYSALTGSGRFHESDDKSVGIKAILVMIP